ncbi:zinc-binding dehydrogenase [Paraneptunicella aestuarii]|uniref:zinc-binding dehydrogenase n=1 Tax=Paraneptunicella aestuarii TaxID=2831148 RepID=UPI001E63D704|nr:zinc-binding dehydrogenase [Paraneptunicella aestuarii]UAA39531.1 zinc-binding dehydrogenase [Paraneptunicella aestuarii]
MKAAVLFETGKPLQVVDGVQIPELLQGQVLVDVHYSGLCHSQLAEVRGHRGEDRWVPHLLGHEAVGTVSAVGAGVSKVATGDKVVLGWIKGEGQDVPGARYPLVKDGKEYLLNSGGVTTFSEQTIASENRLVKLPDGMPDKLAVLLGCALPTGMGLVFNEAKLLPDALESQGKSIAVFGLGGVGLSALIAAYTTQPKVLIAIDVEAHKLELAKKLGATHTIDLSTENWQEALQAICPGGVDYSFEAGGKAETIEMAFEAVRDAGGQCIFASHPKEGEMIRLEPHAFHRGKSIRGSWGGGSQPDRDIPLFVELYKAGKLPNLELLLSHEYSLDEINQALDDLEARKITRALIKIAGE